MSKIKKLDIPQEKQSSGLGDVLVRAIERTKKANRGARRGGVLKRCGGCTRKK